LLLCGAVLPRHLSRSRCRFHAGGRTGRMQTVSVFRGPHRGTRHIKQQPSQTGIEATSPAKHVVRRIHRSPSHHDAGARRDGKGHLSPRGALRNVFGKNPNEFRFGLVLEPVGGKLFDLIAKFQELCITICDPRRLRTLSRQFVQSSAADLAIDDARPVRHREMVTHSRGVEAKDLSARKRHGEAPISVPALRASGRLPSSHNVHGSP
jgi:hypothetical protein